MNMHVISTTNSTLLIPEKFLDFFQENSANLTIEKYFAKLLLFYKEFALSGLLPKSEKAKILYQEEGQNLVKVNFRPSNDDWVELGLIANYLGISRTALFSWFLLLDFAGWRKILSERYFEFGVPTPASPILVKLAISRRNFCIWRKKIYYKIRR